MLASAKASRLPQASLPTWISHTNDNCFLVTTKELGKYFWARDPVLSSPDTGIIAKAFHLHSLQICA